MKNTLFLLALAFSFTASAERATPQALMSYIQDHYRVVADHDFQVFRQSCPELGDTQGANNRWCHYTYNNRKHVLNRITEMMSEISGQDVSVDRFIAMSGCLPSDGSQFNDVQAILGRLNGKPNCDAMNPGDFKVDDTLIRRRADGNYEAFITANFTYFGGNYRPEQMLARINSCAASLAPYLRSPSGEILNIRVLSPEEANRELPSFQRPAVAEITLQSGTGGSSSYVRGDASDLNDGMPCSALVHEMLHHLGLWDLYEEKETTVRPGKSVSLRDLWGCRIVPQGNTIMKNCYSIVSENVPTRISCRCKDNNPNCLAVLNGTDERSAALRNILTQEDANYAISENVRHHCQSSWMAVPSTPPTQRYNILSSEPGKLVFENYSQFMGANSSMTLNRFRVTCDCQGDATCSQELESAAARLRTPRDTVTCPYYMEPITTELGVLSNAGETSHVEGNTFHIIHRPNSQSSLLSPTEFDRLLRRDCRTGLAGQYNSCTRFSYVSTSDPLCASRPPECSQDSYFLGTGAAQQ